MTIDMILGPFVLAAGLASIVARFVKPSLLGKIKPMQEKWGERTGMIIHVIGYTVLPIVAGAFITFGAYYGQ